jgi:hypothetical protein
LLDEKMGPKIRPRKHIYMQAVAELRTEFQQYAEETRWLIEKMLENAARVD